MPKGQKNHALGLSRRAAILDLLQQSPKTRHQLIDATGHRKSCIAEHIRALHEDKKVHICGHIPNDKGMPAAIYAIGNKLDVEYVPLSCPMPKTSAAERRQQVLAMLNKEPMSARQMAEKIHVTKAVVIRYLGELRVPENRQIYIKRYINPKIAYPDSCASSWVPLYAIGNKPDATAPKKESSASRYARLKTNAEYRDGARLRARLNHIVKKARKKPHGIFAALGI